MPSAFARLRRDRLFAAKPVAAAVLVLLMPAVLTVLAHAQRGEFADVAPRFIEGPLPDRDFAICRLMYTSVRSERSGGGWRTDYPYGDKNLSIRFAELTKTRVSLNGPRDPNHYVVRITDDALFDCPFTIASDVGTIGLNEEEATRLREYLLKGGFLWVDDFWGTPAWEQWTSEIAKVLDPDEFPILEVAMSDPVFHAQFTVHQVPQITNIGFWRRSGGLETRERGADSPEADFRVIRDRDGRILVVMTHNTDIADSWEREGEDKEFFMQFSPDGYALGINVLLHAMTH